MVRQDVQQAVGDATAPSQAIQKRRHGGPSLSRSRESAHEYGVAAKQTVGQAVPGKINGVATDGGPDGGVQIGEKLAEIAFVNGVAQEEGD